ncbi:MAG: gliding motility-associated C-terminal domain-containing protein [Saprospiraceae bacterium]|nr:gliding motility-associated C-terminal domain-containing protein [Saprospiraceae bacterium]
MRNYFGFTLLSFMIIGAVQSAFFKLNNRIPFDDEHFLACNMTVDAGVSDTICNPGETVSLNGVITGAFIDANWSPATGVTSPTNATTTASVATTTTFTLTVRSFNDQNLITNGDFAQGNVGFTSDYTLHTGTNNLPDGRYAVTSNGRNVHGSFANCGDHTGGGNMMVVNASGVSNNVWCQTVTVQPNTDYLFGAWSASMVSQNPARLQFSINGNLIGNVFQAPSQTCQWREFTANWTSDTVSTAKICIANVNNTPAGNDFTIDDISFRQVCTTTDQVTITVANLNADWINPGRVCKNSPPITLNTLLDTSANTGGTWLIDGTPSTTFNPTNLAVGNHDVLYRVTVGNCEVQNAQILTINAPANSGITRNPMRICEGTTMTVDLADELQGEDSGGIWAETSSFPSTGGAFNATSATFNTANQAPGTYLFTYRVNSAAPCPPAETTITIIVEDAPTADAGQNMELNCAVDMVTLGGSGTSTGNGLQYQWTAANGSPIAIPNIALTEVEQADTYTLVVTNSANGCSSRDSVTVVSQITSPTATVELKQVTCNQTRNGAIRVTSVGNGEEPFEYSLNGSNFTAKNEFNSLVPGTYELVVRDQNGCDTTLQVTLAQPEALDVELQTDLDTDPPSIIQGDSVTLKVIVSKPDDAITSITWIPDSIGCNNCLTASVSPMEQTTYSVRVTDENGCVATDEILIFVQQIQRVFIPSAFSPNGDGVNDVFYIGAAQEVRSIKAFRILNRWGTLVYNRENILPNDPTVGWDGLFKGQPVQNAVYVYVAELEMASGEIVIISGDITVLQ